MSLMKRGDYLDPTTVTLRDWGVSVAGGLIGTFIAGLQLTVGFFPGLSGSAVVVSALILALVAFTDAYLNAKVVDDREVNG